MYNGLIHAHSGLRWLVVLFLVIAIVKSFSGWKNNKSFDKSDNLIALLLLSFTHLQFVIGLAVYFMSGRLATIGESMKISEARFWSLEHGLLMIFAIALITIGRVKSKKAATDVMKHKKGVAFYSIAFVIILWAGLIKPYLLGKPWF
jgi:hypothetical protein